MPQPFYITTAIDYPNNRPHIGHAFEKIGADVQARFQRMLGCQTYFLIGNDENTIKVSKRAEELGRDTQEYVDEMAGHFQDAWRQLAISNDDFIQTSEPRHKQGCRQFIQHVFDAGYIYKKAYQAEYCDGCESFKTTRELVEGRCQYHPNQALTVRQEENYFFALSKFQDRLLKLYEDQPDFIRPETRRNEIVSLVRSGLEDVAISRKNMDWGIEIPFDPEQTIWVWFDALLNYMTGVGYGTNPDLYAQWWPASMHVIGKDITRFHCALWPAMLMAADVEIPHRVQVHGFVLMKGEKISKSLGNVVDPMDLIDQFGGDAFRYVLMRECPFTGDGEFSYERFEAVYNSDLAKNLGNLYSRILTMCVRYFDGTLPNASIVDTSEVFVDCDFPAVTAEIRSKMEQCQYNQALSDIWLKILDAANRYIDKTKPFELAKTDQQACQKVLVNLAEVLRISAILIAPFVPETAARIYAAFNYPTPWESIRMEDAMSTKLPDALRVTAQLVEGKVLALFPRIDSKA